VTQKSIEGYGYCALCGSNDVNTASPLLTAAGFDGNGNYCLCRCLQCGVVQTYPKPSADLLAQAYNSDYYGSSDSKFNRLPELWSRLIGRRRARWLLRQHGGPDKPLRILDIGCGRGVLLNAFAAAGHTITGTEREGSPFSGLPHILCCDLADLEAQTGSFDIIVLWHVLEHLNNPKETLAKARDLLDNSGSLFISVPNFGSNQSRLFNNHWFHLDLPRHLFHFEYTSLELLLRTVNMKITRQNTCVFDQNTYGFIQSILNYLPGIKNNHLYSLLKKDMNVTSLFLSVAYLPILFPLMILAVTEHYISGLFRQGACLTIQVTINNHD